MARFTTSKKQKEALLAKWPECYVCKGLDLPDSSFAGYSLAGKDIEFDHWQAASLVGDDQGALLQNLRPIHAASEAPSPEDPEWAQSSRRNCHKGKGNKYDGQQWVTVAKIIHRLQSIRFIEDLIPDRPFDKEPDRFTVDIDFSKDEVQFQKQVLPVQSQRVAGKDWRYISTTVSAHLLWTDHGAQPRKANTKRLREVAEDLLVHPLLTPVVCRVGEDGRILVSDGNHRLCGFYLVRPNDKIPVTIWDIPTVPDLLDVLASAHDKLTQQKYQFTDKALKYSGLAQEELDAATAKYGQKASEKLAWQGMTSADVRVRIQGQVDKQLQEFKFREKWMQAGLTDGSWKFFLGHYCKMTAVDKPFDDPEYYREAEAENITRLCEIFDEELIDYILKEPHSGLADSLKTKWWAEGHRQFSGALGSSVRDILALPQVPERLAYTNVWTDSVLTRMRSAAVKWRKSPLWRPGVDRTANNEPQVKTAMFSEGFSERYLNAD